MSTNDLLYQMNQEHHRALLNIAANDRALKSAYPAAPWYCPLLAKLGDQMIRVGQRLKSQAMQRNPAAPATQLR